jgi:hypothetical protein
MVYLMILQQLAKTLAVSKFNPAFQNVNKTTTPKGDPSRLC